MINTTETTKKNNSVKNRTTTPKQKEEKKKEKERTLIKIYTHIYKKTPYEEDIEQIKDKWGGER